MRKEPFLINPCERKKKTKKVIKKKDEKTYKNLFEGGANMSELLLLNPKKKRKKKKKTTNLGERHRIVAYGTAGHLIISPKSKLAPKSRGRVINPLVGKSDLNYVVGISLGFIGSRLIPRLIDKNLPDNLKVGFGRIAVQTASGVVLSFAVGNILKRKDLGKLILYGTLLNTAVNLIDNYILKGILSAEGLSTLQELPEEQYIAQLPEENIIEQLPEQEIVDQMQELSEDEQPIIIT